MLEIGRILRIFLWSFVFIYVVLCSLRLIQLDIWWQIPEGFHILRTFSMPTQPIAGYGLPATPFIDEYPAFEVLVALVYGCGHFIGLWLLFSFTYLAIMFVPFATSGRKYPSFDLPTIITVLTAGLLLQTRLEQRPELMGSLLLVILLAWLRASRLETLGSKGLLSLALIFALWTNTHGSFVLGLFTLALWIACETIVKRRSHPLSLLIRNGFVLGATGGLACFINPYGPMRILYPLWEANDIGSIVLSPEMWPIKPSYTSVAGLFLLISLALLLWRFLRCRTIPLWLIIFAIFSFYMSTRNFRFLNLLAISLLFTYSTPDPADEKTGEKKFWPLIFLMDGLCCFLCLFMFLGNSFTALLICEQMQRQIHLVTNSNRFAPEIVDEPLAPGKTRVPVLCSRVEGTYLSFDSNPHYLPLIDTGLSRYSDDTKRYYFLVWNRPEALRLALHDLKVDSVVLNQTDNLSWAPTLHGMPDWQITRCTEYGQLWQRRVPDGQPPTPKVRQQIAAARDALMNDDNTPGAFFYSTLLDDTDASLKLLVNFNDAQWSEPDLNYVVDWINHQPQDVIAAFLKKDHTLHYPLADALLYHRVGNDAYREYLAHAPSGFRLPAAWTLLEVQSALAVGDKTQARQLYDSIPFDPPADSGYYTLWSQIHGDEPLSPYGQWQVWDDKSREFIQEMTPRLNERIAALTATRERTTSNP